MTNRWDETWHRLREWTNGQAPSERLAAQILIDAEYVGLDPSHPLGGKDGGKDALGSKHGKKWIMAAYFPRGQKEFTEIRTKFEGDLLGANTNRASGIAFVTNQELRLAEREELHRLAGGIELDLFHLERITAALDKPSMASVRYQFLGIESITANSVSALRDEISAMQQRLEGLQTGGDSFCYLMFYHFDLEKNIAQNFTVIRKGQYPLYDLRLRIVNMNTGHELNKQWGEISAPAEFNFVKWQLTPHEYYRVFIHARNGQYHQDLQLRRSHIAECWLAATRVTGADGATIRFQHIDNGYESEFGEPEWK
ncbi:hypothetical protein [Pseudoduganella aquatica]|uniref:hypothetical protein n=1 Tax=Pseudoduganella aquatica TaxID=2660641 RepID=UPI001E3C17D3|nr:hypothetical protein [Pseudoduganella aquatica]